MNKIIEYDYLYKILDDNYFLISRVYDKENKEYFIYKKVKNENKFNQLEYEYNILKKINSNYFLKPLSLNKKYILFENFESITLKDYLKDEEISLEDFLIISINIVKGLLDLHTNNLGHYNLTPYNILINKNKEIKIFGLNNLNKSCTDLNYISPEQTGRFNYNIDYRSDFYSLGIILYEILTGKLPFSSNEQMELIHYHMAYKPDIINNIPIVISDILFKLLSKHPNDRYKNLSGLEYDLNYCLDSLNKNSYIENFEIAKRDINSKILFFEKIYGRNEELSLIRKSFESFKKGNLEIVLVSGESGMGKSVFIDKILENIKKEDIYYIYSKFDKLKQDKPYSSIIDGIRILIKKILSKNNEQINEIKFDLINKLGSNLSILIELIPEIKLIVGKNFISLIKTETETYTNINLILSKFILVIISNNLLFLRLDDLQWTDQASLNFMKNFILSNNLKNIFLVFTYREKEINENVKNFIDNIKNIYFNLKEIKLLPLSTYNICEILSDTLSLSIEEVSELANTLINKTNGNPFFIQYFIKNLYENELIRFDKEQKWIWDISKIAKLEATENIVNMNKIFSLNKEEFKILKIASFIGNSFNFELLSFILNKNINEIKNTIHNSIKENIIIISENYFKFAHNKIQDSLYSSVSEEEKKDLHYEIGKSFLKNIPKDNIDIYLFEIVNQLNFGIDLIKDYNEKYNLAILNFKAGQKAKLTSVFSLSLKYFSISLKILEKEDWVKEYNILFSLYIELSYCYYFLSEFNEAEKFLLKIYKKANNNLDKAIVCDKLANLYISMDKIKYSIDYSTIGLKYLGINLNGFRYIEVFFNYLVVKNKIKKINFDKFEKNINNEFKYILTLSLYSSIITTAYMYDKNLMFLATLKMFLTILKNGNNYYSSFSFITLAVLMGKNNINNSEITHEAIKLVNIFENDVIKIRVNLIYATLINPWKSHLKTSIDILNLNLKYSIEGSDLNYYAYSIDHILLNMFLIGNNINDIYNKIEIYSETIFKINNVDSLNLFLIIKQLMLNLKGMTYSFTSLNDDNFNEDELIKDLKKKRSYMTISILSFIKMLIFYLLSNFDNAFYNAQEFDKNKEYISGNILIAEFFFYYSLILIAKFSKSSKLTFRKYLRVIKRNQKYLKEFSEKCPSNFLNKYYLVDAELKRIKGDNNGAFALYNKSIELSEKYNYRNIKAIANELLAKFMIYRGETYKAKEYILNSYNDFINIGAKSKVLDIEKKYSYYLYNINYKLSGTGTLQLNQDIELDLNTMIKAYQALSEEFFLDKLISKYMKIVVENAGAQKAYFILNQKDEFLIISEYTINSDKASIFNGININEFNYLSKSVVNYVQKTNKEIIIDDAYNDSIFSSDKYISENKTKSIICIPILKQKELLGILYLENNLTTEAFTHNRIQLLKLISSQLAISLENTKLYNDMKDLNLKLEENKVSLEKTVNKKTKQLKLTQQKLIENAYTSGVAEITTGLLHNIGNVLNSINVSNQIINDIVSNSKINGLIKANYLVKENINDIENFILNNTKGKKVLEYYLKVGDTLSRDNESLKREVKLLTEKITLIKNIINTQQDYAKKDFLIELMYIEDIMEDVLIMHYETLTKEEINILKKYSKTPKINIQKSKVLSILFNIIKNSREALVNNKEKIIEIKSFMSKNFVILTIYDNGIGVEKENLSKIFTHGFTTKKDGHGFGLHSCANFMTEMNGKIIAESEGLNKGTTFKLFFPLNIET